MIAMVFVIFGGFSTLVLMPSARWLRSDPIAALQDSQA